jgi:branched-chain amino acid transport system ATP-binding protein
MTGGVNTGGVKTGGVKTGDVILQARGLRHRFGGLVATDGVDFDLQRGEIHALIGPNGAGKTTLVGLLSGRLAVQEGRISLQGQDITRLPAQQRVRRGIAYTFQITSIFPGLSVIDNVLLAAQARSRKGAGSRALAALARVRLMVPGDQPAGDLSYGHQRLLELAMGLALTPDVLILDEPTQGLAAGEIAGFVRLIESLVPAMSVLIIEHNMPVVMDVATRITVLDQGRVLATGTPAAIRDNAAVQEAYLGA